MFDIFIEGNSHDITVLDGSDSPKLIDSRAEKKRLLGQDQDDEDKSDISHNSYLKKSKFFTNKKINVKNYPNNNIL
jgi:hypothetical protein